MKRKIILSILLCFLLLLCAIGIADHSSLNPSKETAPQENTDFEDNDPDSTPNPELSGKKQPADTDHLQENQNKEMEHTEPHETETVVLPETDISSSLPDEEINARISELKNDGSSWAVYINELNSGMEFVNGMDRMQAASLIKLFIMGAAYENYDKLLAYTSAENLNATLKLMITISDNDAANTIVTWLGDNNSTAGMQKVNDFAASHGYADTHMGRMLLAPADVDDNYTSVTDCGRFLSDCYNNLLTGADNMQDLLLMQERRSKIPAGIPEGVAVGNKTGELEFVHNDAAIIYKDGAPYILCIMSENLQSPGNAVNQIADFSRYIYELIQP